MGTIFKYNPNTRKVETSEEPNVVPTITKSRTPVPPIRQVNIPTVSQPDYKPEVKGNTFMKSGNWINKAFDLLRTLEYGRAGFGKGAVDVGKQQRMREGKSLEGKPELDLNIKNIMERLRGGIKNIIPGISQRTETSSLPGDYNAGKLLGLKGKAAEIFNAVDTFMAPSLPIGKTAKVLSKVPGVGKGLGFVGKAISGIGEFAKKTPILYKAIEKVNPFFRRPEFGKMLEEGEQMAQTRVQKLYKQLSVASKGLTPAQQSEIGQIMEGGVSLNEKFKKIAAPFIKLASEIGDEAVKIGVLDPKDFAKYKGRYMTHIFEESFKKDFPLFNFNKSIAPKISGQFFKTRKDKEGYIQAFAPALFKGLGTEIRDIEHVKLYKRIADKFGETIENAPEGFRLAKETIKNELIKKSIGNIALPPEIIDYINKTVEITKPAVLLNLWKQIKTIYNPSYHFRNLPSNQILTDMGTGKGLAKTVSSYFENVFKYFGKGNQIFVNAAENAGLIKNPNFYSSLEEFMLNAGFGKNNVFTKLKNAPRKLQLITEETSKLNFFETFIKQKSQTLGMTVENVLKNKNFVKEAVDRAQEAIFSPYNINRVERESFKNLIPFYNFTRQALPFFIKTLVNHPERLVKYPRFKSVIERMSPDEHIPESQRPENIKRLIRLPHKTETGKSLYYDPTYVYPWGNFGEGGGKGQLPFGLSLHPGWQEAFSQLANYDSYFEQPITKSNLFSQQFNDRLIHLRQTMAPTLWNTIVDKLIPTFSGLPDYTGQERSKVQAIVDLLGIRTKTFSTEELRSKGQKVNDAKLRSIDKEYQEVSSSNIILNKSKRLLELKKLYDKRLQEIR